MNPQCHLPPAGNAFALLPGGARLNLRAEAKGDHASGLHAIGCTSKQREAIYQAVNDARELEPGLPDFGVVFSLSASSGAASAAEVGLLAVLAVVADRALRGLWTAPDTLVLGRCAAGAEWVRDPLLPLGPEGAHRSHLEAAAEAADLGDVRVVLPPAPDEFCKTLHQRLQTRHPSIDFWIVDRLAGLLDNQGATAGHPSTGIVHFPVVGGPDSIVKLTVKLVPAARDSIEIANSLPEDHKACIVRLLTAVRQRDNPTGQRWRTSIVFPSGSPLVGRSYELALVVADRIARGREFRMPEGKRLIATGAVDVPDPVSDAGVTLGTVSLPEDEDLKRKGALLVDQCRLGERVLIPGNWHWRFAPWREDLRGSGVSVASVGNALPADGRIPSGWAS